MSYQPKFGQAQYFAGLAQFLLGNYNDAIERCRKAKETGESRPWLYLLAADSHFRLGARNLAAEEVKSALALDKDFSEAARALEIAKDRYKFELFNNEEVVKAAEVIGTPGVELVP